MPLSWSSNIKNSSFIESWGLRPHSSHCVLLLTHLEPNTQLSAKLIFHIIIWQCKTHLRQPAHVFKQVVCLNCAQRETLVLRGELTPTLTSCKLFLRVRSTDTWVGCLVDQVGWWIMPGLAPWHMSEPPCQQRQRRCHCAVPEVKNKMLETAWQQICAGSLARAARIFALRRGAIGFRREVVRGELGFRSGRRCMQAHAQMHDNSSVGRNCDNNANNDAFMESGWWSP